jgi:hypothetical protein
MISRSKPRIVRPEIEARIAVDVTKSLPNLKTSSLPKRADTMEARPNKASKATERQKPCVVMKRSDSAYPVQLRRATEEFLGHARDRSKRTNVGARQIRRQPQQQESSRRSVMAEATA